MSKSNIEIIPCKRNSTSEWELESLNSRTIKGDIFQLIYEKLYKSEEIPLIFFKNSLEHPLFFEPEDRDTESKTLAQVLESLSASNISDFFDKYHNFLMQNKQKKYYKWAIAFICNIFNYCDESQNHKKLLFFDLIDSTLKSCSKNLREIFYRLNLDISFPFLCLKYEYVMGYLSGIASRFITEEEFKKLYFIHGENFFIDILPIIVKKYSDSAKWTWKPEMSFTLKRKIIKSVDCFSYLKNLIESKFLTIEDSYIIAQTGCISLDFDIQSFKSFVEIFIDQNNIFGIYAQYLSTRTNNEYYDIFDQDFNILEEADLIQIIKTILPVNLRFFKYNISLNVFKVAINYIPANDYIHLMNYFTVEFCHKMNISRFELQTLFCDFLTKKINQSSRDFSISDIFRSFMSYGLSINNIFYIADFLIDNKNFCHTNPIYFRWYLIAMGLKGKSVKIDPTLNISNINYIIESVIHLFKNSSIYVFETKKISWQIGKVTFYMANQGFSDKIENEGFTGINLIWNKLNSILFDISNRPASYVDFFNILNVFGEFIYVDNDDDFLIQEIFLNFHYFCSKTNNTNLFKDICLYMNKNVSDILICNESTTFIFLHHRYKELTNLILKRINSIVYHTIKYNDEVLYSNCLLKKEKFDDITCKIFQKIEITECNICMCPSLKRIKLNCDCKSTFCVSCIFLMRHKSKNFLINCPTCRKESSYLTDIIY